MLKKTQYKIILAAALIITGSFLGAKWSINNQTYKNSIINGNKAISEEKYDAAITSYEKALKYKNDSSIGAKIELARSLKTSKENYNSAVKQMNNKKYLEAIDLFKKVNKQDDKRYKDCKNKIEECKKQYLVNASDALKNNKFDDANNYLNDILKLDADNTDAKKLKIEVAEALQKQKSVDANNMISFDEALQIVINSTDFKESIKGAVKIEKGIASYEHPDHTIIGLEVHKEDQSPVDLSQNQRIGPQLYSTDKWNIDKNKNVYVIPMYFSLPHGGGKTGRDGYLVQATTGKLYRWSGSDLREVN